MKNVVINKVEFGYLTGERPRVQGSNARLGEHGQTVYDPIVRITSDGVSGFGRCRGVPDDASMLVGKRVDELFDPENGGREPYQKYEYAIWDLVAKVRNQPVYELATAINGKAVHSPLSVPCYDTSLYFDDLHLESHEEAADLIAREALQGYEGGHRAFKIKIGRGARHIPLEAGTQRDILVIQAVRKAVGAGIPLMIDANNGYNLNLTKRVLSETADCDILWIEEAFHEDPVLYRDLKEWMVKEGLNVLIADGEGHADFDLLKWAKEGLIDVIQYDVYGHGFTRLLEVGRELSQHNIRFAPHHYGSAYGNPISCHLFGAVDQMMYVEWDTVDMPGLELEGYSIIAGQVQVPDSSGFGLKLDEDIFQQAVAENGSVHQSK